MIKERILFFWVLSLVVGRRGMQVAAEPVAFAAETAYTIFPRVEGIRQPVMLLNGKWQFKYSSQSRWTVIEVPGEAAMQGYAIGHDKPFLYRKWVQVPADYAGHRVVLRFDGVYSHAVLKINGKKVREHHGGFTRWDTDVTSYIYPGRKNEVILEVTDRLDDISYASGYAHHPIGGILRDVTLFALPLAAVCDVRVETHFDSLYRHADLHFACRATGVDGDEIGFRLTAPNGREVKLVRDRYPLVPGDRKWVLPVKEPQKWDAEHPRLYALAVTLWRDGKVTGHFTRQVGFREIRIAGNRMLVNGLPVKLRGACRHDIHPTLGRTTTAELDSLDVLLFKEANMNFVRTSHYPPTERFLEFCDRYGIYVECETAVCFVNTYRQKNYAPGATQNDSLFTGRYLGQCREMVKSFSSHPSVLFWSIGNESAYGSNFQLCWDWVKAADTTRPVIFSYPGSGGSQNKIYDILSMHYQDVNGNLAQWGMTTRNFQGHGIPALFDEWAHPACYTYSTLQHDPNIREFWGQSLDRMWSGLFEASGGLGGAIWGYVDETFALPAPAVGEAFWKEFAHTAKPEGFRGKCVGYGEWGIVDVWRRRKPEFWSTRKAYSPIRLQTEDIRDFTIGHPLIIPVYNRFDHTGLDEIWGCYTYKGVKKNFPLPAIAPHQKGIISIPAENWETGEVVLIAFFTTDGKLIDTYRLVLGREKVELPSGIPGQELGVKENDSLVVVYGKEFEIPFSRTTGLITGAKTGGRVMIGRGPFLNLYINLNHLTGAEVRSMANFFTVAVSDWKKTHLGYRQEKDAVYVDLSGTYQDVKVDFRIRISPAGELDIDYLTTGVPNGYLRETGLAFDLPEEINRVEWKRKGYWNYYLEGAFSGNEGQAELYTSQQAAYGERPSQPWQEDIHEYYYWADAGTDCRTPLTRQAKGMKENIYWYTLSAGNKKVRQLSVVSEEASVACRLHKGADGRLVLYTDNRWDYPEIAWGNYCKRLEALPCYGKIKMILK